MPVTVEKVDDNFVFHGSAWKLTEAKNAALLPYRKCIKVYGLRLELLPTIEQISAINQQIGNARFIANQYLSARIEFYNNTGKTLSVSEYKKNYLPALKEKYVFLKKSDKFAIEAALSGIDSAYKNFFEHRAKAPKYISANKPRGNKYSTNETNGNLGIPLNESRLPMVKLPKIGLVRFILPHRQTLESLVPNNSFVQSRITSACITHVGQRYFISFQIESIVDIVEIPKVINIKDVISIDMGIKSFAVYGNQEFTETVENPKWIKRHAKRLRRFQQDLSRKQYDLKTRKGSKNWEKARLKVLKEQRKCANQRRDMQHKLSRKIADSCMVFICENLNIKGMMRNRRLSKSIASVGWGSFLAMVKYKLEAKGGTFHKISRWFPSSKLCSCGYKKDDLTLSDRFWQCPKCFRFHDRDENAKNNIFDKGIQDLTNMGYQFVK